jgi:hypothetical protein
MNWLTKLCMPLDPDAYKTEPDPARQGRHQVLQRTPWGVFKNKIDPAILEEKYRGVHATQEEDLAVSHLGFRTILQP